MLLLTPHPWQDYQLIDTGGFEKLERFGQYILRRPEPQAIWSKSLTDEGWHNRCDAWFVRKNAAAGAAPDTNESGQWHLKPNMPQQWWVQYAYKTMHLHFRLGLTGFKHVGLFPEQTENWNFIFDRLTHLQANTNTPVTALNLFAYTGGASLAAKAAGADVVHVDSVKQVIHWAKQNMEASGLTNIRWVVEDALKFAEKEVKRQKQYHALILDPPAYGRGPNGEKWLLDKHLNQLLHYCSRLLLPGGIFVINLYSLGQSALMLSNLQQQHFPAAQTTQCGELYLPDEFGKKLPLGIFLRLVNGG